MTEKEIRDRVRLLKEFYKNLTIYGVVNAALILIWLLMGGGAFWPIWVIVGWGVGLLLSAVNLGVVPQIQEYLPFFSPEWEEEQIKRMLKEESRPKASSTPKNASTPKPQEVKPMAQPAPKMTPKPASKPSVKRKVTSSKKSPSKTKTPSKKA